METTKKQNLTARQYEILELISKGLTNKEICKILNISSNTVKVHVATILQVLDVTNRTEAAMTLHQTTSPKKTVDADAAPACNRKTLVHHQIAILPFTDLTGNNQLNHLVHSLQEDLVTRLLVWRYFSVLSVDSNSELPSQELSKEFRKRGICYFISGSIRNSDNRLRISYSVTETVSEKIIISQYHPISIDHHFEAQDSVSLKIAATVVPLLLSNEGMKTNAIPSPEMDSWYYTMRGYHLLEKREVDVLDEARNCFEKAIQVNASCATAFYGLTLYNYRIYTENRSDNRAAIVNAIVDNAKKCLTLDNKNPIGYLSVGISKMITGSISEACEYIDKAVYLNPGFVTAYLLKGQLFAMIDRLDDAISLLEKAAFLSPDIMTNGTTLGAIALVHFAKSNYVNAISCAEQCLNMIPGNIYASAILTSSYALLGETGKAHQAARELHAFYPDFHLQNISLLLNSVNHNHVSRFINGLKTAGALS